MNNLIRESKQFKILFEKSQNLLSGRYNSKIKGDGLEFVDLKEYIPGDDIRKIDWKVTARTQTPFVKEFLENKDASHYILIDTSASMKNKSNIAKILATSLLLSSNNLSDNFALVFFNSEDIKFFELSKSKNQLMRYIYEISKVDFKASSGLKDVLIKFLYLVNKKSIISIISDELEYNNEIKSLISVINYKHKLNFFHLHSSNEKNIDLGLNSFEDIESGESGIYDLDDIEIEEYKKEFDLEIENTKNNFLKLNIRPFILDIDKDIFYQIKKSGQVI